MASSFRCMSCGAVLEVRPADGWCPECQKGRVADLAADAPSDILAALRRSMDWRRWRAGEVIVLILVIGALATFMRVVARPDAWRKTRVSFLTHDVNQAKPY